MTDRDDVEFLPYEAAYEEQVVELALPIWGADLDTSRATLHARYVEGPNLLLLAIEEGRVVGMGGLLSTQWQRGRTGPIISTLAWGDTVIAEDHRGSGLLRTLKVASRARAEALGHESGICAHAGAPVQFALLTLGWRSVGAAERHVRGPGPTTGPARVRRAAAHLVRTGRLGRTPPFEALDRVRGGAVQVERTARVPEMLALIERTDDDDRLRKVRDAALSSRTVTTPWRNQRLLYAGRGGELDGFVLLESSPEGWTAAVIDWGARDDDTLVALFQAIPRSERLELQAVTLSPAERHVLTEAGFRPEPPANPRDEFRLLVYGPDFASLDASEFGLRGIDF